ncbi:MAG: hypothetical protein ACSLFQ_10105 [Thermoanaerobaculia bacterium]
MPQRAEDGAADGQQPPRFALRKRYVGREASGASVAVDRARDLAAGCTPSNFAATVFALGALVTALEAAGDRRSASTVRALAVRLVALVEQRTPREVSTEMEAAFDALVNR